RRRHARSDRRGEPARARESSHGGHRQSPPLRSYCGASRGRVAQPFRDQSPRQRGRHPRDDRAAGGRLSGRARDEPARARLRSGRRASRARGRDAPARHLSRRRPLAHGERRVRVPAQRADHDGGRSRRRGVDVALVGLGGRGEYRGLRHRSGTKRRRARAAGGTHDRRDAGEDSGTSRGGTGLLRRASPSRHLLLRLPRSVRRLRRAAVVAAIVVARRRPMRSRRRRLGASMLCVGAFAWHAGFAQQSIGRGAPDPYVPPDIVGSEGKGYWTGAGVPPGYPPIYAARDGDVPPGVEPLPVDIFSTKDFYKDQALWFDPRYYRCNSPVGLEQIWGAYEVPLIGDDPPRTAAWGFCDRDYPREEIVSPYEFRTAKAHYEALLAEARARGGPTIYTQATLPNWS